MSGTKKPSNKKGATASPAATPAVTTSTPIVYFRTTEGKLQRAGAGSAMTKQNVEALGVADPNTLYAIMKKKIAEWVPGTVSSEGPLILAASDAEALARHNEITAETSAALGAGEAEEVKAEEEVEAEEAKPKAKPKKKNESAVAASLAEIVNFVRSSSSVTLHTVRRGFREYAANNDSGRIQTFMYLSLAAVGSKKEVWAKSLIALLKDLGEVPLTFAGDGGTYKAFLYLAYDIMMEISKDSECPRNKKRGDQPSKWPAALIEMWSGALRVCPNGDIRDNRGVTSTQGAKKTADKQNAIAAAKAEFENNYDDNDFEDYLSYITQMEVDEDGSMPLGTITDYKAVRQLPKNEA